MKDLFSVIVSTYNRCGLLNKVLEGLSAQETGGVFDYEVIVADNNSTDNTRGTVEFWRPRFGGRLRYLFEGRQGKSFALNTALREARGGIIAFTDDDVFVDRRWLLNFRRCFERYGCDGVGGRIIPVYPSGTPAWIRRNGPALEGPVGAHDLGDGIKPHADFGMFTPFAGANMAVRAGCVAGNTWFRTDLGAGTLPPGEDTDFYCRLVTAGKKLYYCGDAVVYHRISPKKMCYRYIASWTIKRGRSLVRAKGVQEGVYYFGYPRWVLRGFLASLLPLAASVLGPGKLLRRSLITLSFLGELSESRKLREGQRRQDAVERTPLRVRKEGAGGYASLAVNVVAGRTRPGRVPGKTRCLFLMKSNVWGGAERRMAGYCANVDYSACSVTWGVMKDVFSAGLKAQGIPVSVRELPAEDPHGALLPRLYRFYRFIASERPDMIVASNFWLSSLSVWEMMIAALVARGNVYMVAHDCPLVPVRYRSRLHFGIIPGIGLSWHIYTLEMKLLPRIPKCTLAVSDTVKRYMVRNFRFLPEKMATIRSGVDLGRFAPSSRNRRAVRLRYGIGERDVVLLSAARMHKRKRLERSLKAFAACVRDRDDLWLILAGDGDEYGSLFSLAQSFEERIRKRVIFTGFVADAAPLMQASDIFIMCSDTEGFGNASLEALACGLTVVVTKCNGPEEYIVDGVNGYLVENSTQGVSDGVRKALELDTGERNMIGARAREYVEKTFDRQNAVDHFLALLDIPRIRKARPAPAASRLPQRIGEPDRERPPAVQYTPPVA